ncbi:LCP family protein [Paenibacillus sp. p3-SID1389]|uniref:LCP family protein n=1 Tax=Paenibacillus sp. p3-SID1389 TaxID=2916364 RepID=UPI0021A4D3C7|nr:LCP family protein [Paenibacillus sp. p3-SID1389]MCT2194949.1 LCP family protein [Paenibacillus sp. p3-SID1389]
MKFKIPKKVAIPVILLLLAAFGLLTAYLKYEPSRHFRGTEIPVLATPERTGGDVLSDTEEGIGDEASSSGQTGVIDNGTAGKSGAAPSSEEIRGARGSFNLLLLATDARAEEASRTDVLLLAHVNPEDNTVNLVSIPRDTQVNLPGIGLTKINHAHAMAEARGKGSHAGTLAAIQAVSNLCRCTINYYVKTNFSGFEHFVDTIGGIDVKLEAPVKLTYNYRTLPAGEQHWNGETALDFVRERKSLEDGDNARQRNQALVVQAIARRLLVPDNLTLLPELIRQVKEDILDTNLTDADMLSLAWMVRSIDPEEMYFVQFPGSNGKAKDPLVGAELYYWIPSMTAWSEMSRQLLGDEPNE